MATFIPQVTDTFPDPALYSPDFSFLDKMLTRRKDMYDQGFNQVNSAYSAVNRDVTHSTNAQTRDNFLKQATNNLKNLSSMDLSQQQNVDAATNVFSPFVKNTNVLGDMALTKWWSQQESIGESFRLKDGGKEFSQDNIDYVKLQKAQFAADSPDAWKGYYMNKRSYTPYYDWNKEVQDKMKDFKPSSTKIDRRNGMYIVSIDDASWTNQEVSKYLEGVLSDKAKQQMKIESSVRLGANPPALAAAYGDSVRTLLPVIDSQIKKIDQAISREKNPDARKELEETKDYYLSKEREINTNLKNINDPAFLKANGDTIAYNIYHSQTVAKLSNAFAHKDIEQRLKGDEVAMMYYREGEQWKRTMYSEAKADAREAKKLGVEEPLIPISGAGENVTTDKSSLIKNTNSSGQMLSLATEELKGVIMANDKGRTFKSMKDITEADVSNYINNHPSDEKVKKVLNAGELHHANKDAQSGWEAQAEAEAKRQMGADAYAEWESIRKKALQMSNVSNPFLPKQTGDYDGLHRPAASKLFFDKRGQELQQMHDQFINNFNSKKNTVPTKFTKGFQIGTNDKRYKPLEGRVEAAAGQKVNDIQLYPTMGGFDIAFKLADNPEAANATDRDKKLTELKAKFAGKDVKYNKETDVFTVKDLGYTVAPQFDPYAGMNPTHKQVLNSLENIGGTMNQIRSTSLMHISGKAGNHFIQIDKLFGANPESNSYLLSIDNVPIPGATADNSLSVYSTAMAAIADPDKLNYILNHK